MYLKSLTCKGFKSFADRSVLSLEPGITAIIGPNGSGKSNVLDAVLWVLGERNARNLRGQAMEDVIFAGSSTRKHVGMAEVVLVLDNSDGTLPVDFDEVSITRRMYRNGESEYLINGAACRRMDVLDILHDTGLGAGTHSIISQGHLDSVLQSRPEDRRDLIEEAAGVLKHKQRKARSERKLERMDQHLLRIRDITREVERQLKPLERKAKRAATYKVLAEDLAEVTLDLALDDLRTLQAKWEAVKAAESEYSDLAATKAQAAQEADGLVQRLQGELQRQAEGAGETAGDLQKASRAGEQVDSTMLLLAEKKRSALRVTEERRGQLDSDLVRLTQARQAHEKASATLGEVSAQRAVAQQNLEGLSKERDEVSRAFADMRREQGKAEQREAQLTRDIERLRQAREKAADALSSGMADGKLLAAQREDAEKRLTAAGEHLAGLEDLHAQAREELRQAVRADEECRSRQARLLSDVDARRSQLEAQRVERARQEAQVAGLEQAERTARAANKALGWALESRQSLGVRKLLMEAVEIPGDLTYVVESLLAGAADALLVDDAAAAGSGLSAVAGTGTEGAVSLMAVTGFAEAGNRVLPSYAGATRLVDSLVCDEAFKPMLERLLGDVALCATAVEASNCAKELASSGGRWRVASRDGCLIDDTGLHRITRPGKGAVGTLERHRELREARNAVKACARRVEDAADELSACEAQLREAQKQSLECASQRAKAQGTCDSLGSQVEQARSELARQRRELEEIERRSEKNAQLIQQMKPDAERMGAELAGLSEELASVRERLQGIRDEAAPLRRRSASLNDAHTEARLEAGKLAERESYARRMVEGHAGDISRLEQHIERMRREVGRAADLDGVDAVIEALSQVRSAISVRITSIELRADAYKADAASLHGRVDASLQQAFALRAERDEANERLSEARVQKGRLEVQVEAAIATIREECSVPLESALARPELEDRQACEGRAAALRKRIANLGPINPEAASEYAELKERFDFLQSQVADMQDARRALEKIVSAIDDRMRGDFIETFHAVDANFQRIFAQLFPGGQASLSLVDESDPDHSGVEVTAQPKGKRIAKMSLMSGGEKSLTALALLFAVYATRPTPFYILDEVEAALDDTNLRRLCAFLDDLRMRTQLIMITHQRRTMEMADVLYGVSMQSDGVTRVISQKLDRTERVQED